MFAQQRQPEGTFTCFYINEQICSHADRTACSRAGLKSSGANASAVIPDEYLPPNKILFLRELPESYDVDSLTTIFSRFEGFREVRMVPGRKGIAFVEYEAETGAISAKVSLYFYIRVSLLTRFFRRQRTACKSGTTAKVSGLPSSGSKEQTASSARHGKGRWFSLSRAFLPVILVKQKLEKLERKGKPKSFDSCCVAVSEHVTDEAVPHWFFDVQAMHVTNPIDCDLLDALLCGYSRGDSVA